MNLINRVLSAIVGIIALASVTYFFSATGLAIVCGIVIFAALNEFRRAAFSKTQSPFSFHLLFVFCSALCFAAVVSGNYMFEIMGVFTSISIFFSLGLWLMKTNFTNEEVLNSYGVGLIGIVYCAIFPSFVVKTLFLSSGTIWFYSLLVIVFSGDTLAYFGGRIWGKKKLHILISPKKTVAGCVSGAVGSSALGAGYFYFFFPNLPVYLTLPFCLICGLTAQSGDLFVSLIKRVADVKDTGKIMPGHGGILDRLDGIYMSAPLVYTFSVICLYFFDL